MADNNGGPALSRPTGWISEGMTLRDWFAGQAMQSMLGDVMNEFVEATIRKPHDHSVSTDDVERACALVRLQDC